MRSNNPIFNRSPEFNRSMPAAPAFGEGDTATDPSQWQTGSPTTISGDRMTVDSVVMSTGISLITVVLFAIATWWWTGPIDAEGASRLMSALLIGSLGAFALSMVNSFKRVISPALVLAFAALEGVALGALSKFIDEVYLAEVAGGSATVQAVIGTAAAFAGTLAAYKILDIKVSNKFRMFVVAAMFGMVALGLLEFVLSFFGAQFGLFGFTTMGLVFAVAGLVLGVFMLILDFDFVEQGIRNGLPERESWRAAFAMTVSLVWIYTNLLKIIAILRGGD